MKLKYLLTTGLLLSFMFLGINLFSQPKIIWEKYYTFQKLESAYLYNFFDINDTLYLTYYAENPDYPDAQFLIYNPGVIICDKTGNKLNNFELIYNKSIHINALNVHNDLLKFYCIYTKGFSTSLLNLIITDKYGIVSNFAIDSSYLGYLDKPLIYKDSVFYFTGDTATTYLISFNDKMHTSSTITFDYSEIDFSLKKSIVPTDGIITKDDNIISILTGPGNKLLKDQEYSVIIKFNFNGKPVWHRKLQVENFIYTQALKLLEMPNGELIVFGDLYLDKKNIIPFIAKLGNDGQLINLNYKNEISKSIGKYCYGYKYIKNGNYFVGYGKFRDVNFGYEYKYYLEIYNYDCDLIKELYWGENKDDNAIWGLTENSNGNIIIYGRNGWDSVYLAEIDINDYLPVIDEDKNKPAHNYFLDIKPNPIFNQETIDINIKLENNSNIKIDLINTLGIKVCEVYDGRKEAGENNIQFMPPRNLTSGVYWLRMVIDGKETAVKAVIIQ